MRQKRQILFVHRNAPGQFAQLIRHLVAADYDVWFASQTISEPLPSEVKHFTLPSPAGKESGQRKDFEWSLFQKFARKRRQGLDPSWVVLHTGWGLGLSIPAAFPQARLLGYAEWWFLFDSEDFHFDPDNVDVSFDERKRIIQLRRNRDFAAELAASHVIVAPTAWQREQLPIQFRRSCRVIHEGCDTSRFCPNDKTTLPPPQPGSPLASLPGVEVPLLTYATRGMDPYRGFPEWCRALERLLQRRTDLHVAIAGSDRVVYAPGQKNRHYGAEAQRRFSDLGLSDRVHWLGFLAADDYVWLLQRSDLHIYFTRPFVLSWSLIHAMACGCAIVASDVAPVREVISHGIEGLLVDHTAEDLHQQLERALEAPDWSERRQAARTRARQDFSVDAAVGEYHALFDGLIDS